MSAASIDFTESSVVYWLFDETCVDPMTHGYIGITGRLRARLSSHRSKGRLPHRFSVKVLFEGSRAECFAFEERLRPKHQIGWNINPGGQNGYRLGAVASTRAKVAATKAGKPRPDLAEINRARWSQPEVLAGLHARNAGNSYAKGQRNALGYRHTPETLARLAEAARGNRHSAGVAPAIKGKKQSEAAREKMRAAWAAMSPEARAARTAKARINLRFQRSSQP